MYVLAQEQVVAVAAVVVEEVVEAMEVAAVKMVAVEVAARVGEEDTPQRC